MEAKHTKGEWKARNNDNYCLVYSELHGGITLCNHEGKHKEEHEANAKLIAAAPDLLEACAWAIKQFKRLADEGRYPEFMMSINGGEGYIPLVKAIKKATE